MPISYYIALFLALAYGFCNASIHHESKLNLVFRGEVHVLTELEIFDKPLQFDCTSGSFEVGPTATYGWYVDVKRDESCHVTRTMYQADFIAWDRENALPHKGIVYWQLNSDGFFYTYDPISPTWQKGPTWKPRTLQ